MLRRVATCALAWSCALAAATAAAEDRATLAGSVSSRDGARLPGVSLEVSSLDTGARRRAATGDLGVFRIASLAPGAYAVRAELAGFEPRTAAAVVLVAGRTTTIELTLEVAGPREVVTVLGPAPRDSLEASEIRETAARDAGEAVAATPGVFALRRGGIASDVVLRGLQSRDLNLLIDGQRVYGACPNHMDPPSFHVDFAEVDRIEVGKGPFDLRNQGGLGGTINVVTRRPEPGWHARANLAAGSFGFWNPALSVSRGGATLSALAGASYRRSSPYEDGDGEPMTASANYRPAERASDAFRVATAWGRLAWQPATDHTLQLAYTRQQADHVLYPYLLMDAVFDDTDRLQLRYDGDGLAGGRAGLSAQAYYTHVDHWMTDALRTSAAGARGYSMGTRARTQTVGGRVEARIDRLTLGAEAYERRWDTTTEMAGMGYAPQRSIPDTATRVAGLYAEYARPLGGRVDLVAGARLDGARSEAAPGPAQSALYRAYHATTRTRSTDTLPSAKLRVSGRAGSGFSWSAGVGHAARPPEPSERFIALRRMGTDWVGDPGLSPSRNTGGEFSLEYEHAGLRASASAFASRIDGFVTVAEAARVAMAPGVMNAKARTYANVDATLRGGEAAVAVPLARHVFASGDVSYVRGTQPSGDLPEIPPLRGRLGLRFDDGRVSAAVEGLFVAAQDHVDASLGETPTGGYTVVNLRAALRQGRLSLAAGVENLFDRLYSEHLSYQRDPFRSGVRVPAPGRSLFVNLAVGI